MVSKASAAMFKLNIIREALNLGQDLHLTKNSGDSNLCYPYNPLVTENSDFYKSELDSGVMEIIGEIKSEGTLYTSIGRYFFHIINTYLFSQAISIKNDCSNVMILC